jgi:predicted Rossmann fold nucleotide-binding protein DprA/Smf involved in DNA uptake
VALGPAAELLLTRLQEGALTADELVRSTGVDAASAAATLLELELVGQITLEDGVYRAAV